MIKTYMGEEDDNVCPDQSRCPPEFSCLRALTRFGCCPLAQGVPCSDGKHCCPEGHQCSADSRSCSRKEVEPVTAEEVNDGASEKAPEFTTANTVPPSEEEASVSSVTKGSDVLCNDTVVCSDGTTCCKTLDGGWACCPLPEAVCCKDFIHCCPKGKTCNLAALSCDDDTGSVPWAEKVSALPRQGARVGDVTCDSNTTCPDGSTCCKTKDGHWACCPLPQAVCCDDHEHCCPTGTTCDLTMLTCNGPAGATPMEQKMPAFVTPAPTAADTTTPSPAVCCSDGDHCCPAHYKCNERGTSCVRGDLVIPWYTKLPATTSVQAEASAVQCDGLNRCPERTTCCRLFTGVWGCCPLQSAVCCPDKEHCCPQGYSCDIGSKSCQKVIMLQLETVPLTPVYLPEHQDQPTPLKHRDVQCDTAAKCNDGETCCRTSAATWGCCPSPNAVCCGDMSHCCPSGYTCIQGGVCVRNTGLHWHNWNMFLANKKRALIV
ncbi:hypothetical protein F2P81_015322 [Scophthalmus maximus]|uniref:Granulins domain-containing protein n=1 Tax=Scophthalmus maximus TaxID=52904 RepID=A0A6A4SRZ8_SCOMX|nr:hypothetical protein F2P81_015322 [Scophthalmus maximus]